MGEYLRSKMPPSRSVKISNGSPLLITLTRKTLSSCFLEDWISVFSIFSVPSLKFAASSVSTGSVPQRSSVSMSDCSLISK